MPTYQYKREDGTTFEILQRISDEPLKTCPETGQKIKRIITGGGGVVYKGSGWYVTDYKNKDSTGSSHSGSREADTKSNGNGSDNNGNGSSHSNSALKNSDNSTPALKNGTSGGSDRPS